MILYRRLTLPNLVPLASTTLLEGAIFAAIRCWRNAVLSSKDSSFFFLAMMLMICYHYKDSIFFHNNKVGNKKVTKITETKMYNRKNR